MRHLRPYLLPLLIGLAGCPSEEPPPPEPPAGPIPWDIGQPALGAESSTRGLSEVRGIAHLHSHWSHDACDGNPQPEGIPDEDCLADLRYGLCATQIDVAFLSDHSTHANEAPLAERLLERGADELILDETGSPIATWLDCEDGHRVLLMPGVEASLMPFGIEEDLPDAWGSSTPESVEALRESGAAVWISHTEEHPIEELRELGLDGFELYQLHANLDPGIREEFLGLEPYAYLGEVAPFFFPEENGILDPPHPDLAPLAFLELNEPATNALETLGLERPVAITGGTDAHQNVFPMLASDGERIDSYRRMIRWFNNRLRIEGELSPQSAKEALISGRNHIVFEAFGTPDGFDFRVEYEGTVYELGSEPDIGRGVARVLVDLPTLNPLSPQGEDPPEIVGRLFRATQDGRELVQEWTNGPLDLAVAQPGVYRVEVWISPFHLRPYLGEVANDYLSSPIPWIQSGGIFVRSSG